MFLLAEGPQPSDMNIVTWIMFFVALIYDILLISAVIYITKQQNKHPYRSKEYREWESLGMVICLPGLLPFIYLNVFLLIPLGLFDLPH